MSITFIFTKAAPGQALALGDELRTPEPKAPMADSWSRHWNPPTLALLTRLDRGSWDFLSVQRYNSWNDFGADQTTATAPGAGQDGWGDVRQHVAFHRDTL
jgi:hypothetical protein